MHQLLNVDETKEVGDQLSLPIVLSLILCCYTLKKI